MGLRECFLVRVEWLIYCDGVHGSSSSNVVIKQCCYDELPYFVILCKHHNWSEHIYNNKIIDGRESKICNNNNIIKNVWSLSFPYPVYRNLHYNSLLLIQHIMVLYFVGSLATRNILWLCLVRWIELIYYHFVTLDTNLILFGNWVGITLYDSNLLEYIQVLNIIGKGVHLLSHD